MVLAKAWDVYGKESGGQMAEFSAIDDDFFQHKWLVRDCNRVVKYVGDGITNIPNLAAES